VVEDFDACYRAVQSRDERFDGWFVTAVHSTGIYCRPSCPATTPKARNVSFFASAAAAQHRGFRACKRCRPDATPGSPQWNSRADVVARAMRLIADGVVDREGVAGLASRLGYSSRQVTRQLTAELGAGPLALARTQRAQTARVLIETTAMPMCDVAFASGFSSIRQFNDTVREVFALAPTGLRRAPAGRGGTRPPEPTSAGTVSVRLPFRRPLWPDNLFGHLVATGVPGVEEWAHGAYRRTVALPHGQGVLSLSPRDHHVACTVTLADLRDLATAIWRARRLLDLDADPVAVDAALGADPALACAVTDAPGRRIPRTADEAEFAVRCVIGQQISTAAARAHGGRLVASLGAPLAIPDDSLTHCFPTAEAVAGAGDPDLRLPGARRNTVRRLAAAVAAGTIDLSPGADWRAARDALGAVGGVGPWTVELIAMRALGDPDAFVPGDLGVRAGAAVLGLPATPGELVAHAERWRPWRSYAVQHLWGAVDHAINRLPDTVSTADSQRSTP